ncbi:allophanate hydrolase subunit 1 [uncultured Dokdonia sp.]|uniref:5-oxoprolinase subunit B family protein n=1 Tax=uncultured Dokdonia sp. TaxID=575653 RepID=UPI002633FAA6|nr:allophanate hydrolase subunit 1 [uncultured Dokdonia sp.]
MQYQEVHIFKLGENAWSLQWQSSPSRELLQFLLAVKENLQKEFDAEIIHTYTEILLKRVRGAFLSDAVLEVRFREIIKSTTPLSDQKANIHRIPVCYESSFGEDLESYLKAISLTLGQLIELHTKPLYTVYFMGFLPGFPYLDGLDERLYIERKSVPSQRVKKGSVAIGGKQTGIYPQDSPGGWYTIGHSPITLFDVSKQQPSPCVAGDYIRFYAIDATEHTLLKEQNEIECVFPITEVYGG